MTPFSRPGHTAVLFLCTGNYYRSRFAERLFNHHARAAGLEAGALSRGLRLNPRNLGPISRHVRDGLAARGLEVPYPARFPEQLRVADLVAADLVVAVDEREHRPMVQHDFREWQDRIRYWDVPDVDDCPPADALARLEAHITALVAELVARADGHATTAP